MDEIMEKRLKRQLEHFRKYLEIVIDLNNAVLLKRYPYPMHKPSDSFWRQLEMWTKLFLNAAELLLREDVAVCKLDADVFLEQFWNLELYIPDSIDFFPDLLPLKQITIELPRKIIPPKWLVFITTRYEEGEWSPRVVVDGTISLLLIRDRKLIAGKLFGRGTVGIGPFALGLYTLTDDDWEKIIQIVNNARTT
jgi:hypothetical protein